MAAVFLLALFSVLAWVSLTSAAEAPKKTLRIIAYGDNEGILQRPGKNRNVRNMIHHHFVQRLRNIDAKAKIDLILHTGDLVRFDPGPGLFIQELGPLLARFYPTTGGDEEFELGRYYTFVRSVPHLKEAIWKRIQEDRNGFEYYYHVQQKGAHIISLFNPDNYGAGNRPEHRIYDVFRKENEGLPQLRWLVKTLETIRRQDKQAPIVVLSHRPVLNQSRFLTDLFDKLGVSVVLSGDAHVYARAKLKKTLYLVTGIMGDLALGGCGVINDRNRRDFQMAYEVCLPEGRRLRLDSSQFMMDHYLDLTLSEKQIEVKAVALSDNKVIDRTLLPLGMP